MPQLIECSECLHLPACIRSICISYISKLPKNIHTGLIQLIQTAMLCPHVTSCSGFAYMYHPNDHMQHTEACEERVEDGNTMIGEKDYRAREALQGIGL